MSLFYARRLRKKATPSEQLLWKHLRRKQLPFKFRRQQPMAPYIVDFFCPAARLVIELDGESHIGREDYDYRREQFLKRQGLTVLRFWNSEVFQDLAGVLEKINSFCLLKED
jgi:very-short-patch-repair endonuclease